MRLPTTVPGHAALALGCAALAIPLSIRHHFFWGGALAPVLHGVELAGIVAAAAGLLWMQLRVARLDDAQLDPRLVDRAGLALCLVAALALPMLSEDVFSYLVRGRVLAVHGANPYTVLASQFAAVDPSVGLVKAWADFPLPYGPATALYQGAVAWSVDQLSFWTWDVRFWIGVYAFKVLHGLALYACGRVVGAMLARAGPGRRARAILAVTWNPFLLLEVAGSGHNDVLMALPLLFAFAAAQRDRFALAGFWLVLSAQLKFVSLILGPLFLVLALRRRGAVPFCSGAGLGGLVFAALALPFWLEPGALDFLSRQTSLYVTPLHTALCGVIGADHAGAVRLASLGLAGIVALLSAVRVVDFASLVARSVIVLLVLVTVGLPASFVWYHVWWAPLVPFAPAFAGRLLLALAICAPIAYAPVLLTRTWGEVSIAWQWAFSFAVPLLVLVPFTRSAPIPPDSP